mmetsp:Transcript_27190/g.32973  ORF Transcript_27190/g.32973 Transcript_27190/m.32973 type:complete len:563 (+) Transcript_27190:35-1723(+)
MKGTNFFCLVIIILISASFVTSSLLDDTPVSLSNSAFASARSDYTENATKITTGHSDSICQPKQIHLANGVEPWSSMIVSFSTSCQPEDASFSISYGFDPFYFDNSIHADPDEHMTRYNHTQMINEMHEYVFYQSDYIYHVPLEGLQDNRRYFYQINLETEGTGNRTDGLQNGDSLDSLFDETRIPDSYHRVMGVSKMNNLRRHMTDETSTIVHPSVTSTPFFHFTTAPIPGQSQNSDGDPIKIVVVGDLGQTYNSSMTMYHMLLEAEGHYVHGDDGVKASLVMCAGDMSYADSNQTRWDKWFDLISPLGSRLPFMVAPGNHEEECDVVTKESFVAYENRFAMPKVRNAERGVTGVKRHLTDPVNRQCMNRYDYGNSYYAFTYGTARIVMTNCFTNTTKGSFQYNFILDELQSVNRTVTPWLFVVTHCPIYNTFNAHQNETQTLQMQEALEPLFVKYHVNIVFAGHTHGYMHSKNVQFGLLNKKAPIYVIVGEGGNREEHVRYYLDEEEMEDWVEVRDKTEFGFGTVELLNDTHVRWKWIRNEDVDVAFVSHEYYIENQVFL